MTSAELILARSGDQDATPAAVTMWRSIVGDDTVDPIIPRRVKPAQAGAGLDQVAWYVGPDTDIPSHTIAEATFRTGSYLQRSGALLGFHGGMGSESTPDADPARGGFSALRRSGAMALLEPWKIHRAGIV